MHSPVPIYASAGAATRGTRPSGPGTELASVLIRPGSAEVLWVTNPTFTVSGGILMTYQKPAVQRFGSLRELTLGAGPNTSGDATSLYHRS
jgi:hypothetical protein